MVPEVPCEAPGSGPPAATGGPGDKGPPMLQQPSPNSQDTAPGKRSCPIKRTEKTFSFQKETERKEGGARSSCGVADATKGAGENQAAPGMSPAPGVEKFVESP